MRIIKPFGVGLMAWLRIPMRGYEMFYTRVSLPAAARYESPCGVMSSSVKSPFKPSRQLRIPMRGYEDELFKGFD